MKEANEPRPEWNAERTSWRSHLRPSLRQYRRQL